MLRVAANKDILRKRVLRLLRIGNASDQSEISTRIVPFLRMLGNAGLIGGAVRDVARAGRRGFHSDLDFVIYGSDHQDFLEKMLRVKAVPNKFGGYGLKFHHWKVDLWHIEDTWAKTSGHRSVDRPDHLLGCTFFDWDSVVFDIETRSIIASDDYICRLQTGVMDICLEPNPNPSGSLVRALRRAAHWGVGFGPTLTTFALSQIQSTEWNDLVEIDESAFSASVLKFLDRDQIIRRLEMIIDSGETWHTQPVPTWSLQMDLPFSEPPSLSPHGM
ncbi:hypothetical protein [uncultured Brevundimonas sp.]|uniref:hypothetical protein n=1 Tax=uncultured Brevundimonas sp. TaxID=213418 RepID=UPI0025E7B9F5|nr:hypothetical protein [uncultured Brevundimonas sp.]